MKRSIHKGDGGPGDGGPGDALSTKETVGQVKLKVVQEYVIYGFIYMLNILDFISNMKPLKGLNQSNETTCV